MGMTCAGDPKEKPWKVCFQVSGKRLESAGRSYEASLIRSHPVLLDLAIPTVVVGQTVGHGCPGS